MVQLKSPKKKDDFQKLGFRFANSRFEYSLKVMGLYQTKRYNAARDTLKLIKSHIIT